MAKKVGVGAALVVLAGGCGGDEACSDLSETPVGCLGTRVERIWSGPYRDEGLISFSREFLKLDDTHVYWSTSNEEIARASKDTLEAEVLSP